MKSGVIDCRIIIFEKIGANNIGNVCELVLLFIQNY